LFLKKSEYGYFKLKEDEIAGNGMQEKFFEKKYGVCMVDFKEENKHVKLFKLDSYQKALLDNSFVPPKSSPIKTSTDSKKRPTMTNKLKLISNQNDRSNLVYDYVNKNVRIEISQGNLLDQQVEIVVNAANTELSFGGYF